MLTASQGRDTLTLRELGRHRFGQSIKLMFVIASEASLNGKRPRKHHVDVSLGLLQPISGYYQLDVVDAA